MKLVWKYAGPSKVSLHCYGRKHAIATVYVSPDCCHWYTWDARGAGGENSSERTIAEAKRQAMAAAIIQGFVPGIDVADETPRRETE